MIYLFYFLLLFLLLYLERKEGFQYNIYRAIIPTFYLLFVGLRGQYIGVDTPIYYEHYYYFGPIGCDFVEYGFDFINQFCYHQGWSHVSFFLICAFVTIFPVGLAMFTMDRKEFTVMALMFYTISFVSLCNGMRQNMACGLFFWVVCFIYNSKKSKYFNFIVYVLVISFASLFHSTALLLLPLYFLKYLKTNKNVCLVIYILSFAFIFIDLSEYVPTNLILIIGVRDYTHILEEEEFIQSASYFGFVVSSSAYVLLFVIMYKYDLFRKYSMLANLLLIAFVLKNVGFNIPIVSRLSMYTAWFVFLIIAKIYNDYYESQMDFAFKTVAKLIACIYVVITIHSYLSPQNMVYPYQFFWEEQVAKTLTK